MQEGRTREPFRLPLAAAHELKAPLALVRQLSLALETGDYTDTERAVLQQRITLTAERALRLIRSYYAKKWRTNYRRSMRRTTGRST